MTNFDAFGVLKGNVAPPSAVVVPEMVIGIRGVASDVLEVCSGHGIYRTLVFNIFRNIA